MQPRPVLLRIPFSHYCRKVEWGLTQAGIEYDTLDIPISKMLRLAEVTESGTVPQLIVDGKLLPDSDGIMAWAAKGQSKGEKLVPNGLAKSIANWEKWSDEKLGPLARREAYRVAYNQPWQFRPRSWRPLVALARPLILNILKHYKVRRDEEEDERALPLVLVRIKSALAETDTPYLLGKKPTLADLSVAALAQPLRYAAGAKKYHKLEGWREIDEYIDRVKPRKLLRRKTRRIKSSDWAMLAELSELG